jgi:hypothetical protein
VGSIYDDGPFDPMTVPATAHVPEWVLHGPECARGLTAAQRAAGEMCERHRAALLAAS